VQQHVTSNIQQLSGNLGNLGNLQHHITNNMQHVQVNGTNIPTMGQPTNMNNVLFDPALRPLLQKALETALLQQLSQQQQHQHHQQQQQQQQQQQVQAQAQAQHINNTNIYGLQSSNQQSQTLLNTDYLQRLQPAQYLLQQFLNASINNANVNNSNVNIANMNNSNVNNANVNVANVANVNNSNANNPNINNSNVNIVNNSNSNVSNTESQAASTLVSHITTITSQPPQQPQLPQPPQLQQLHQPPQLSQPPQLQQLHQQQQLPQPSQLPQLPQPSQLPQLPQPSQLPQLPQPPHLPQPSQLPQLPQKSQPQTPQLQPLQLQPPQPQTQHVQPSQMQPQQVQPQKVQVQPPPQPQLPQLPQPPQPQQSPQPQLPQPFVPQTVPTVPTWNNQIHAQESQHADQKLQSIEENNMNTTSSVVPTTTAVTSIKKEEEFDSHVVVERQKTPHQEEKTTEQQTRNIGETNVEILAKLKVLKDKIEKGLHPRIKPKVYNHQITDEERQKEAERDPRQNNRYKENGRQNHFSRGMRGRSPAIEYRSPTIYRPRRSRSPYRYDKEGTMSDYRRYQRNRSRSNSLRRDVRGPNDYSARSVSPGRFRMTEYDERYYFRNSGQEFRDKYMPRGMSMSIYEESRHGGHSERYEDRSRSFGRSRSPIGYPGCRRQNGWHGEQYERERSGYEFRDHEFSARRRPTNRW
jgi:hypothetical protein